jgi:HSP20 family protein
VSKSFNQVDLNIGGKYMAITRWEPFQDLERWDPFRWEPFREIETLQRQMNRLFDRLMPSGDGERRALAFMPSAEMEETADEFHLKLEVPGLEPKDISIEVTENSISITGERKEETRTEEKGMFRSEFHYGRFERVIPLPAHIQSDKVKAEYKNGILNLTLPKVEQEKRKAVKVEVG